MWMNSLTSVLGGQGSEAADHRSTSPHGERVTLSTSMVPSLPRPPGSRHFTLNLGGKDEYYF